MFGLKSQNSDCEKQASEANWIQLGTKRGEYMVNFAPTCSQTYRKSADVCD